jgi:hypothetical protein
MNVKYAQFLNKYYNWILAVITSTTGIHKRREIDATDYEQFTRPRKVMNGSPTVVK